MLAELAAVKKGGKRARCGVMLCHDAALPALLLHSHHHIWSHWREGREGYLLELTDGVDGGHRLHEPPPLNAMERGLPSPNSSPL